MAIVAFDVNETLLSLDPLHDAVASVLGPGAPAAWFARLLHGSLVANHLDVHRTFEQVAAAELRRLAAAGDVAIAEDDVQAVVGTMRRLPAHPDVGPGLDLLADAGHRLVAFTNGTSDAVVAQLAHAGIDTHFDAILSVDAGRYFKPHADAYATLAALVGAAPRDVTMVAAHDWDVAGARAVGMRGVFIQRDGPAWWLPDPPGATATTIAEVADHL